MTFDDVRAIALAWPGMEDSTSYGTPALKVKGKLMSRLKEDGDSLVMTGVGFDERDMLIETQPNVFYLTEHYRPWPSVLIRLSNAAPDTVRALLLRRWKELAPKKLAKTFADANP